jgi:acyl-CoA reductase-like NAD-dependent aldehyde dehydrogenase
MFPSIVSNDDYCSSVNQANFDRVIGLIEDARANGASVEALAPEVELLPDRATRKIAPTIVRDIDDRVKIAAEEIFGPVLVVKGYSRLTEAIDYIYQRPAPLVAEPVEVGPGHVRRAGHQINSGIVEHHRRWSEVAAHVVCIRQNSRSISHIDLVCRHCAGAACRLGFRQPLLVDV